MLRNVIRSFAIALIVFPEPVTTALGILILAITFAVTRQKSLRKFGNLEVLVQKSLQNEQPIGFRRYLAAEQPVIHHTLTQNSSSQSLAVQDKPEINLDSHHYQSWFDNRQISEKVLYHTLKTSFPQYERIPENEHQCNGLKKAEPLIVHHKLKLLTASK